MSKVLEGHKARKVLSIALVLIFLFWSLFIVCFRSFVTPPGAISRLFIAEAKDYYFEKSTLASKNLEFRLFIYKDLWQSLPQVDAVVMTDEGEGADIDFGETPVVRYLVIDNLKVVASLHNSDVYQRNLFEEALDQVSAAEWKRTCERLVVDVFIWAALCAVLVVWLARLRRLSVCMED